MIDKMNYKDVRITQKEDLYFRKKALLRDMFETVEDTQKMKDEVDEGFEEFLKSWREKNENIKK